MSINTDEPEDHEYRPALIWHDDSGYDEDVDSPSSLQARISRARGSGKLALLSDDRTVVPITELDQSPSENQRYVMLFDTENPDQADFSMVLVQPKHTSLPPARILRLPEYGEIPVSREEMLAFPSEAQSRIERNPITKVEVQYNSEEQLIEKGRLGWGIRGDSALETYMYLTQRMDDHIAAMDYVLSVYAGEEFRDLEVIADRRDATVKDVKENLKKVYNVLHSDNDKEAPQNKPTSE